MDVFLEDPKTHLEESDGNREQPSLSNNDVDPEQALELMFREAGEKRQESTVETSSRTGRRRRIPQRFSGVVQGEELDNILKNEGVIGPEEVEEEEDDGMVEAELEDIEEEVENESDTIPVHASLKLECFLLVPLLLMFNNCKRYRKARKATLAVPNHCDGSRRAVGAKWEGRRSGVSRATIAASRFSIRVISSSTSALITTVDLDSSAFLATTNSAPKRSWPLISRSSSIAAKGLLNPLQIRPTSWKTLPR